MPAYSGLYDGVFGTPYAPIAKPVPAISGILRVMLQKRGLYGYARAFGGAAPLTVKGVDADRNDMQVRGGWDYATRTDDAANKVTITNIGGDINALEDINTPALPDGVALNRTRKVHLNRQYAKDDANLPVTAPALTERYAA